MNNNLGQEKWKGFYVGDIFRLVSTKGKDSTELIEGDDIPYIAAKKKNNGYDRMCQLEGFEDWVSEGNCIVFVQLGQGSAGYVDYIPNDFIGMNGKTKCGYIDGILNENIGLFLMTILDLNRPKYSFGRSWTGKRLSKTKMMLPVVLDDNQEPIIDDKKRFSEEGYIPDWDYMDNFIEKLKNIERDRIAELLKV